MRYPSSGAAATLFASGVILVGFGLSVAWADPPAPDHTQKWKNGKVSYGIADDIQDTNADGIAHDNGAYPYAYCRRGVQLDTKKPKNNGKLKFSFHRISGETIDELQSNLFVLKKSFGPNGGPIAGSSELDWPTTYEPFNLNWTVDGYGTLTLKVPADGPRYFLYRYLHFPNELKCTSPNAVVTPISSPDSSRTKLIVFIHGWNSGWADDMYSTQEWTDLYENWKDKLSENHLDWNIIRYDWHVDAATGGLLFSAKSGDEAKVDGQTIRNATEAAEISHMHGQHLGELLLYLFPSLEKVHFLAHSAGSWAARTAARQLLLTSNVEVQVTLLDPFMPYEGGSDDTSLGKSIMDKLDSFGGNGHLYRLDNYYSIDDDAVGFALPGTQEVFDWRDGTDVNHQVSFVSAVPVYADHASPIQFYADSLIDKVKTPSGTGPSDFGWKKSMANEELSSVGPTAAFSADRTSGDAPLVVQFTDQSTAGSTPIISWAWDFNNDGTVDSTAQNPEPPPTFEEPGTYDVKLTVYSASGSDDELKSGLITVGTPEMPTVSSFQINDGAASTTSRTVTLNNVCSGNPTHFMASEFADFNGATWQTYNVAPAFELSDGVGTKTVYFKVKSGAGESGVLSDSIALTADNPTDTIILPGNVPLEMVWIPAGSFMMGRYENEQASEANESPQHQVTFTDGFWVGKYEVTQAQWAAVMGNNPSYLTGDLSRPVEQVSWNTVQAFVTALNTHVANTGQGSGTFRLPSEAQWEYACRAGTTTRCYWGDDPSYTQIGNYAWYAYNSTSQTHPVGQKLPNAWGLYDMLGNVWEWCEDWYHSSYTGAPTDGSAWVSPTSSNRVARGGGRVSIGGCRSANRGGDHPSDASIELGFRLAR